MTKVRLVALASAVAAICSTTPLAYAQATRTWVSGVGDDVNPCSRTAPCKTFAGAISKTASPGEIDTLDPGGFGTLTITKSITIDGTAGLGGVLASGVQGFVINAASTDTVILRNLDINGAGTTLGTIGVHILSARDVRIENCKIYGFSQLGISDQRTAGRLVVTDTVVNHNGMTGILVQPSSASTLIANLENVRMDSNGDSGLAISMGAGALVSRSTASGNTNNGFSADSLGQISLESSIASANNIGILNSGGTIIMSNTTVSLNNLGISGGNIYSFGNNRILGNSSGSGAPSSTVPQQ
jgi:hypothetical protein